MFNRKNKFSICCIFSTPVCFAQVGRKNKKTFICSFQKIFSIFQTKITNGPIPCFLFLSIFVKKFFMTLRLSFSKEKSFCSIMNSKNTNFFGVLENSQKMFYRTFFFRKYRFPRKILFLKKKLKNDFSEFQIFLVFI